MDKGCEPRNEECPYWPYCVEEETSKYRPIWQIIRIGSKALAFANAHTEHICRNKLDKMDARQEINLPTAEEVEVWYAQQEELEAMRQAGF